MVPNKDDWQYMMDSLLGSDEDAQAAYNNAAASLPKTPDDVSSAIKPQSMSQAPNAPMSIPLPNGGMEGQQLQNYIKSNPGPEALTGFNPNFNGPQRGLQALYPDSEEDDGDDGSEQAPSSNVNRNPAKVLSQLKQIPSSSSGNVNDAIAKLLSGNNDQLQAAMQARNSNQFNAELGKAANTILGGVTRTNPSNAVYDDLLKNANQPLTDVSSLNQLGMDKLKQSQLQMTVGDEMQKNDPKSDISGFYRDIAKKYGFNVPDNSSASTLQNVLPNIEKWAQAEEMRKSNAAYRQAMLSNKNENNTEKDASDLAKSLNVSNLRQNTPAGRAQISVDGAKRLEALAATIPGDDLTSQQVHELGSGLDAMITGNPSVQGRLGIIPTSWVGSANDYLNRVFNQTNGAGMGRQVKNMMATVEREKNVNQSIVQDYQKQSLLGKAGGRLDTRNHDRFVKIANQYGLDDQGNPVQSNSSNGKITVSNGKETYQIDPKDLQHAQADDFQPVGK